LPIQVLLQDRFGGTEVKADHYSSRLSTLVREAVEDPDMGIEDIIVLLSAYDDFRKPLDRVQASNMKGKIMEVFDLSDRPEREGREGDTQPMPIGNDLPVMHHMVQQDLEARLQVGIKRYGQPLQPHNGRDALRDAYEEVLDLAVYLRQAIYESENPHGG
jgi:hypothetical protein